MKYKTNFLTVMLHWVVLVLLSWTETVLCKCTNSDDVSFELTTGYVFSSPGNIIATKPGILSITECIRSCREDLQCQAVNYETGLCVLFASKPDSQPGNARFLLPAAFEKFEALGHRAGFRIGKLVVTTVTCQPDGFGDRYSCHLQHVTCLPLRLILAETSESISMLSCFLRLTNFYCYVISVKTNASIFF